MKLLFITLSSSIYLQNYLTNAHGATSYPQSRQWLCSGGATPNKGVYWNGGNGPNICKPNSHSSTNINSVITDWAGVSQGGASGWSNSDAYLQDPRLPHMNIMGNGLDSKICSASSTTFSALDDTTWLNDQGGYPSSTDEPYPTQMSNGDVEFSWTLTAPHKTYGKGYIDIYITKNEVDLVNNPKALTWRDLDPTPICHYVPESVNTPLQQRGIGNGVQNFNCHIPLNKLGNHVIYQVWQRDDSPEAFYACSDVILGGSNNPVEPESTTQKVEPEITTEISPICSSINGEDIELISNDLIRHGQSDNCLTYQDSDGSIKKSVCQDNNSNQKWKITKNNQIQLLNSDLCWSITDLSSKKLYKSKHNLGTHFCDNSKLSQIFFYENGQIKSFIDERYCVVIGESGNLEVGPCKGLRYGQSYVFGS